MKKSFLKSKVSSIRRACHYRKRGLEFQGFTLPQAITSLPSWLASPGQHCQVISPGRSGTRWLANVLVETSNALVCHSTPITLAEPGYLLDSSMISNEQALGAYRSSRGQFLCLGEQTERYFIDLDCKNTPFASIIADAYEKCTFLVMLRNPISFIKSGIIRGYFIDKNPCSWGHLESLKVDSSLPKQEWQIYKIAAFWRSIALRADSMLSSCCSKAYVLNTSAMFVDSSEITSLFNWLDLAYSPLADCKSFGRMINTNRSCKPMTSFQQSVLDSKELKDFCFASLSNGLIEMSGFSYDLA